VITDVGQPVYATDDDTFVFSPVGGVFVGFVHRFVSAGVVIVDFDALEFRDPYGEYTVRETLSATRRSTSRTTASCSGSTPTPSSSPCRRSPPDQLQDRQRRRLRHRPVNISPNASDKVQGPTCRAPTTRT
jgi:hypothetical protein